MFRGGDTVSCPVTFADEICKIRKKFRFERTHGEGFAVFGLVEIVERASIEHAFLGGGGCAACEMRVGFERIPGERAVEHREVDIGSAVSRVALLDGGEDGDDGVEGAREVGDLRAERGRDGVRASAVGIESGFCEIADVVSRAEAVGAGRAVAGERKIDEIRANRRERVVRKSEFFHHAGAKLFDHDVIAFVRDEFLDDGDALFALEIESHGAFVATKIAFGGARAFDLRFEFAYEIDAIGSGDSKDFGAHVREVEGRERSG